MLIIFYFIRLVSIWQHRREIEYNIIVLLLLVLHSNPNYIIVINPVSLIWFWVDVASPANAKLLYNIYTSGLTSSTLDQHYNHVMQMFCVYWEWAVVSMMSVNSRAAQNTIPCMISFLIIICMANIGVEIQSNFIYFMRKNANLSESCISRNGHYWYYFALQSQKAVSAYL